MLLQLIEKCGYTVNNVAEALKVSTQTISEWNYGRRELTRKQSRQLARLLGVTEKELADWGRL